MTGIPDSRRFDALTKAELLSMTVAVITITGDDASAVNAYLAGQLDSRQAEDAPSIVRALQVIVANLAALVDGLSQIPEVSEHVERAVREMGLRGLSGSDDG